MQYNVKETGAEVRFVWTRYWSIAWFSGEWSFGRHRSRALGKTNQAPIKHFNVSFFWYKLRSLGVQRHITTEYSVNLWKIQVQLLIRVTYGKRLWAPAESTTKNRCQQSPHRNSAILQHPILCKQSINRRTNKAYDTQLETMRPDR